VSSLSCADSAVAPEAGAVQPSLTCPILLKVGTQLLGAAGLRGWSRRPWTHQHNNGADDDGRQRRLKEDRHTPPAEAAQA